MVVDCCSNHLLTLLAASMINTVFTRLLHLGRQSSVGRCDVAPYSLHFSRWTEPPVRGSRFRILVLSLGLHDDVYSLKSSVKTNLCNTFQVILTN